MKDKLGKKEYKGQRGIKKEKWGFMFKNDYRRVNQQCPECGQPYLHERTLSGRYEWSCPKCGLVVWEVQEDGKYDNTKTR